MNAPDRIIEARGNANCDKLDAYHRRIERIGVIAEMLFMEVVRDNHKDYPPRIVAAVAFLSEELADGADEQARIDACLAAVEEQAERYAADIHTLRPMRGEPIPF